jgi:hypothetical protein
LGLRQAWRLRHPTWSTRSTTTTFRPGGSASPLGAPIGTAVDVAGGAEQGYQGGVIFYSPDASAKIMYGEILKKYRSLGGPAFDLGFPTNDESDVGDGVGKFNDFTRSGGGSIYWSPASGAFVVNGKVLEAWRASGATTAAALLGLLWRRRRAAVTVPPVRAPDLVPPRAPRLTSAPPVPDVKVPPVLEVRVPKAPEVKIPPVPEVRVPKAPEVPRPTTPRFEAPVADGLPKQPVKPDIPAAPAPRHGLVEPVEVTGKAAPLVINYDDDQPASRGVEVTYENNAIGSDQQSHDDKSDRAHHLNR